MSLYRKICQFSLLVLLIFTLSFTNIIATETTEEEDFDLSNCCELLYPEEKSCMFLRALHDEDIPLSLKFEVSELNDFNLAECCELLYPEEHRSKR